MAIKVRSGETIAAIATPPGSGGIGIIRVSGPESATVLRSLHAKADYAINHPRELTLGKITSGGAVLDQGLGVFMPGPRSYTGEDVAELQLHASLGVLRLVLEATLASGARLAEPGEFTRRAYLNGKLDLAQAEAVADLIAAHSASAVRQAGQNLAGELSKQVNDVRSEVVNLVAELSANLDFSEEDVPDMDGAKLHSRIVILIEKLNNWLTAAKSGAVMRDGFTVAIVGLPNAGKSSLLNALAGHERAIVTPIAGTTRDTLDETIEVKGLAIRLIDTAGLREGADTVEAKGIERARSAMNTADAVMMTASAKQDVSVLDVGNVSGRPLIAVQTKIDAEAGEIDWPVTPDYNLKTSAKSGAGIQELKLELYSAATNGGTAETAVTANTRHLEALTEARNCLVSAAEAARTQPPDIVAADLGLAADALAAITGADVGQSVVDAIFSRFCIGK
jgi:tRNA modification GTPase